MRIGATSKFKTCCARIARSRPILLAATKFKVLSNPQNMFSYIPVHASKIVVRKISMMPAR